MRGRLRYSGKITQLTPFLCEAAPNFLSFFVPFSDETLRECALCGSLRQAALRLPSSYSLAHLHTELVLALLKLLCLN